MAERRDQCGSSGRPGARRRTALPLAAVRPAGLAGIALLSILVLVHVHTIGDPAMAEGRQSIRLPAPRLRGELSLEDAIRRRRSVREFSGHPIELPQAAQLLWAAQGETDPAGLRAAPSAGALYPLEVYLVAGAVEGLEPGIYHYRVDTHRLQRVTSGDHRRALARAALGQSAVSGAAAVIAIGAVYERTGRKYGDRARRYVHMEAGHAVQNVLLQATALELAAVPMGAFDDESVHEVLAMPPATVPLYLVPVGRPPADR